MGYNKRPLHASRRELRETLRQRWLPNPSPIRGGETLTQVKGGERSNLNDKSFTEHDIIPTRGATRFQLN